MGRGWYIALAVVAGCSFPGERGNVSDASTLDPPADAEVLVMPDADPDEPDAEPPPPPDADPPDAMPGTPDAPPPPPDAAQATCPGYATVPGASPSGATYRGTTTGASFNTARGICQADGGDLVVIDNDAEADGVAQLVNDTISPYFWIGLFDPNSGVDNDFVSVRGGPPPYVLWGSNQPTGGNQDCVLAGDSGTPHRFYDYLCGAPQFYVCECLP